MPSIPSHLLRSGYFKTEITIQVNNRTKDHGNKVDNWVTFCEEFASISTVGGSDFFAAKQVNSSLTHELVVRFRKGIKSSMRVRYYDYHDEVDKCLYIDSVQHVNNDGKFLWLFCRQLNDGEWRASE